MLILHYCKVLHYNILKIYKYKAIKINMNLESGTYEAGMFT